MIEASSSGLVDEPTEQIAPGTESSRQTPRGRERASGHPAHSCFADEGTTRVTLTLLLLLGGCRAKLLRAMGERQRRWQRCP
jgi:hypothetical protein